MTWASAGWRSRWPQPGGADPAGAEVLVAVEARAALRLRVVEVEHHQPVEPDPLVEVGQERVDRGGLGRRRSRRPRRAPCRGRTRAVRDGDAASGGGLGDLGQLGDVRPEPEPAARRVLEDDHRRVRPVVDLGERPARSPSARRAVPAATPAPRCDPTWTLTNRPAKPGRRSQVAGEDGHRAAEEVLLRSGQVDQVRGVDGDRPDVELGQAGAERGRLGRWLRATAPGGRVVDEDLERAGADLVGAVDGLDHAVAERQVGAEASSVGKHPRHRTTRSVVADPGQVVPAG